MLYADIIYFGETESSNNWSVLTTLKDSETWETRSCKLDDFLKLCFWDLVHGNLRLTSFQESEVPSQCYMYVRLEYASSELTAPELSLLRDDIFKPSENFPNELVDAFNVPKYLFIEAYRRSNGFFGSEDVFDDSRRVQRRSMHPFLHQTFEMKVLFSKRDTQTFGYGAL